MNIFVTVLLSGLALYAGFIFSLYTMGVLLKHEASAALARLLISAACLFLCAVYGILASLALRLVGGQRMAQWATSQAFRHTMSLATNVHFDVVAGEAHLATRPAVLVGNHQTELDVLLLAAVWPKYCSVTAKKSLRHMPFLGWFMELSGTVFLDRANSGEARKAFARAAEEIAHDRQSVFIFPEGTRSYANGPTLLPFKKGAFHLAVQAGVPIVPVVCANYWGVMSMKEWRFRSGRIPVVGMCSSPFRPSRLFASPSILLLTSARRSSLRVSDQSMRVTADSSIQSCLPFQPRTSRLQTSTNSALTQGT